jgi:hypothetical protein
MPTKIKGEEEIMRRFCFLIVIISFAFIFACAFGSATNSDAAGIGGSHAPVQAKTFTKTEGANTCTVNIFCNGSTFKMEQVSGNCKVTAKKSLDQLIIGDAEGKKGKVLSMQEGWFSYEASPGHYCYVNPVTNEYQCFYW